MKAKNRKLFNERFNTGWKPSSSRRSLRKEEKMSLRIAPGARFGRLTTMFRTEKVHARSTLGTAKYWECLCDCGTQKIALEGKLLAGFTGSCDGCTYVDKSDPYRRGKEKEFQSFCAAHTRCTYRTSPSWKDYGGRGILFKLGSFKEFYAHVGPRPKRKSLDRIDNEGNYEIGNLRWATRAEQMQNTRATKLRPKDVVFIRRANAAGIRTGLLSKWMGVSTSVIRLVWQRKIWANIEDPAPVNPIGEDGKFLKR